MFRLNLFFYFFNIIAKFFYKRLATAVAMRDSIHFTFYFYKDELWTILFHISPQLFLKHANQTLLIFLFIPFETENQSSARDESHLRLTAKDFFKLRVGALLLFSSCKVEGTKKSWELCFQFNLAQNRLKMYLMNLKSLRMLIYLSALISVFLIIYTIYISNYNKNILKQNERKINFLMMQQQRGEF